MRRRTTWAPAPRGRAPLGPLDIAAMLYALTALALFLGVIAYAAITRWFA